MGICHPYILKHILYLYVMPRKNLIVCAAGDSSLHAQWCVPVRSYDIFVLYYGTSDPSKVLNGTCDFGIAEKGYKMELARNILLKHFHTNRKFYETYEYVWFPDCDIELAPSEIDRMFVLAKERNASIFQPSIANRLYPERFDPASNWGGWPNVHTNTKTKYRRITHPEIMMPGFSIWAWENVFLRSLYLFPQYRVGWGIESVWGVLSKSFTPIGKANHFVFDDIRALHTKPTGLGSDDIYKLGKEELRIYLNPLYPRIDTMILEEFD